MRPEQPLDVIEELRKSRNPFGPNAYAWNGSEVSEGFLGLNIAFNPSKRVGIYYFYLINVARHCQYEYSKKYSVLGPKAVDRVFFITVQHPKKLSIDQ